MVLTRSNKVILRQNKVSTKSIDYVNVRMGSKLIHIARKSKVRVNKKYVCEMIGNNDAENNVDRNTIILWSMKSMKCATPTMTRSQIKKNKAPIRCTDFGMDLKELCGDYIFCSNCDLNDALTPDLKKEQI